MVRAGRGGQPLTRRVPARVDECRKHRIAAVAQRIAAVAVVRAEQSVAPDCTVGAPLDDGRSVSGDDADSVGSVAEANQAHARQLVQVCFVRSGAVRREHVSHAFGCGRIGPAVRAPQVDGEPPERSVDHDRVVAIEPHEAGRVVARVNGTLMYAESAAFAQPADEVHGALRPAGHVAVVGDEDIVGRVRKPGRLDGVRDPAHLGVGVSHRVGVAGRVRPEAVAYLIDAGEVVKQHARPAPDVVGDLADLPDPSTDPGVDALVVVRDPVHAGPNPAVENLRGAAPRVALHAHCEVIGQDLVERRGSEVVVYIDVGRGAAVVVTLERVPVEPPIPEHAVMAGEPAREQRDRVGVGDRRQRDNGVLDGHAAFDEASLDVGQQAPFAQDVETVAIQAVNEEDDYGPSRSDDGGAQIDANWFRRSARGERQQMHGRENG